MEENYKEKKTGRNKFKKFNSVIKILVFIDSLVPYSINKFLLNFFRNINGNIGLLIRYLLIKNLSKNCGDNVSIHPNVYLFNLKNISFGNNVSIHPMNYIDGTGGLKIGNNVSIAHSCSIMTTNHSWANDKLPIKYNPKISSDVTINDDVWVGCGVRILAGVSIGQRSIIAAGAVVNKDVIKRTIVGGVPSNKLKSI
jgi:acetyltransferase-like isoleucine patch superfamily enzyme